MAKQFGVCEYCHNPIEPVNNMGNVSGSGLLLLAEVSPEFDREILLHAGVCLSAWLFRNRVWCKFIKPVPEGPLVDS